MKIRIYRKSNFHPLVKNKIYFSPKIFPFINLNCLSNLPMYSLSWNITKINLSLDLSLLVMYSMKLSACYSSRLFNGSSNKYIGDFLSIALA